MIDHGDWNRQSSTIQTRQHVLDVLDADLTTGRDVFQRNGDGHQHRIQPRAGDGGQHIGQYR